MPITDTWLGGAGDWDDPTKWSANAKPGALDGAVFDSASDADLTNVEFENIASLLISFSSAAVTIHGELTVGAAHLNLVPNFIDVSAGSLTIDGGGLIAGQFVTEASGTVHVTNGGTYQWNGSGSTQNVDLGNSINDTFQFSTQFDGTISNFFAGDIISYSGTVNSVTIGENLLTFNATNGQAYVIHLTGAVYDASNLIVDGNVVETTQVACYCAGTRIATERSDVMVEELAIGDRVLTVGGELHPIKWIGRRSYGGRFIMGRKDILPICIKAGALDDNVPRRDLWISPHHAMYLEGVLIEARDLVNGVSVVQAEKVEKIEYFHIELDSHDVIIAEGALSESYIDEDNRGMFHNAHEYWARHPDAPREPMPYCAPRRDEGYEVEAARRRIESRAGLRSGIDQQKFGLRGFVDDVSLCRIAGWAQTVEHPEAPVCLDIRAGGQLIGQVLANRYREDLKRAGLGSGCHSFEFPPPSRLVFALDAVEVRRSLDGAILPWSIECEHRWRQARPRRRPAALGVGRAGTRQPRDLAS